MTTLSRDKLRASLLMIGVWSVLLGLSSRFSHWQWSQSGQIQSFHFWWVGVCVLVTSSVTAFFIWRARRQLTYVEWFWLFAPFLVSLILLRKAALAFHALQNGPTSELSGTYFVYACAFIADILAWIVGFPYEEIFGPYTKNARLVWRVLMSLAALLILGVGLRHVHAIAARSPTAFTFEEVVNDQHWLEQITQAAYIFLFVRILLPFSALAISHGFQGKRASVNS